MRSALKTSGTVFALFSYTCTNRRAGVLKVTGGVCESSSPATHAQSGLLDRNEAVGSLCGFCFLDKNAFHLAVNCGEKRDRQRGERERASEPPQETDTLR